MGLNDFIFKQINKDFNIKEKKKSWEPFKICLLNSSTANPAQFGWKSAGLAAQFSRQILNGSQIFWFLICCFKYETIETHARTFLTLNISSIGTVSCKQNVKVNVGKYLLVFTLLQWTPQLWIYANLCKVVWEPLEMGLFTLGKLDLYYLYSSPKVPILPIVLWIWLLGPIW